MFKIKRFLAVLRWYLVDGLDFYDGGRRSFFRDEFGNELREYRLREMDPELRHSYYHFNEAERLSPKELRIDRLYDLVSIHFLVLSPQRKILGTVRFIPRLKGIGIPVENGILPDGKPYDIREDVGFGSCAEVSRLKRRVDLKGKAKISVLSMLFKAVYCKAKITQTDFFYATYNKGSNSILRLYADKMNLVDLDLSVSYGGETRWGVLLFDVARQDEIFPQKSHFHRQFAEYCRADL